MLERDARAAGDRLEADLDLGVVELEVDVPVRERDSNARLPGGDAAHLVRLPLLVDLEQPSSLEPDRDRVRRIVPAVRPALVPRVDLVGEDRERRRGIHRDVDRADDAQRSSACALNASSWPPQNESSHRWTSRSRSGRSR